MIITPKPAVFLRRGVGFTGVFLGRPFYTFLRLRPGPVKWQYVKGPDGQLCGDRCCGNSARLPEAFRGQKTDGLSAGRLLWAPIGQSRDSLFRRMAQDGILWAQRNQIYVKGSTT